MSDGNTGLHVDFSCNVPHVGSIDTPHFVTDSQAAQLIAQRKITGLRKFQRKVFTSGKKIMPDGFELRHWGFADESDGEPLPSPQIRVTEGEIAQVKMDTSTSVHTIHHHGIEPDPFNDGVGHTSFEASGSYTYQWRAMKPGSYWYHCHVNTVLHVQMGLFGTLVVDPLPDPNDPPGTKRAFSRGPKYVHERYWVPYSVDPVWHDFNHAAGLCGEDVGLNNFRPRYFGISGLFQAAGHDPVAAFQAAPINDPAVAITAASGEPILLRILNGQYFPVTVDLTALPRPVRMIASDGRPFLDSRGQPQDVITNVLGSSPAERYDVIFNTAAEPVPPGDYEVVVFFLHWISGNPMGVARTTIHVTDATPTSAQPAVALAAPASVRRGDEFTVSATVKNPGSGPLDGLNAVLTWSPSAPLELRSGSAQVSVGSVAAGATKGISWLLRGKDRGTATLTATVRNTAGSTVASASAAISVFD